MKKAARKIVEKILWSQVKRLRAKNKFTVIAVAGSTGKTSTKLAIAQALQSKYRVLYQEGNYNVPVSVPLIFFNQMLPSLANPVAWLKVFIKNESIIKKGYGYDVVVVELGTDQPGELEAFGPHLKADIGVLTAIAPEHMEYFKTLDAVAKEELTIARMCSQLIFNYDLCDQKYMDGIAGLTYGTDPASDMKLENTKQVNGVYAFDIKIEGETITLKKEVLSVQQLYSITVAALVGKQVGMSTEEIVKGIENILPVSGRMQKLKGINNSVIIDDTYNASPQATIAAIETLYSLPAELKIAVLGNMNELGDYSQDAHKEVGEYCDPKQLNLVVTIGPDANSYLADAAEKNGCKVIRFEDPYSAGEYLKPLAVEGTLILFKGSQNKVFAEEAIKSVLADPADFSKLVRQSPHWLKKKKSNFKAK